MNKSNATLFIAVGGQTAGNSNTVAYLSPWTHPGRPAQSVASLDVGYYPDTLIQLDQP